MLDWNHDPKGPYAPGYFIGSTRDEGEHLREATAGWPYSIYRQAVEIGATDACLCTGIQDLGDAQRLCRMLNSALGRY